MVQCAWSSGTTNLVQAWSTSLPSKTRPESVICTFMVISGNFDCSNAFFLFFLTYKSLLSLHKEHSALSNQKWISGRDSCNFKDRNLAKFNLCTLFPLSWWTVLEGRKYQKTIQTRSWVWIRFVSWRKERPDVESGASYRLAAIWIQTEDRSGPRSVSGQKQLLHFQQEKRWGIWRHSGHWWHQNLQRCLCSQQWVIQTVYLWTFGVQSLILLSAVFTLYSAEILSLELWIIWISERVWFSDSAVPVFKRRIHNGFGILFIAAVYDQVQVRLLGGANPAEGRVEVFYNGRWGAVCQDNFGAWEAAVVCKMLGLEYVFLFTNWNSLKTLRTAPRPNCHLTSSQHRHLFWLQPSKSHHPIGKCVNASEKSEQSIICSKLYLQLRSDEASAELWGGDVELHAGRRDMSTSWRHGARDPRGLSARRLGGLRLHQRSDGQGALRGTRYKNAWTDQNDHCPDASSFGLSLLLLGIFQTFSTQIAVWQHQVLECWTFFDTSVQRTFQENCFRQILPLPMHSIPAASCRFAGWAHRASTPLVCLLFLNLLQF